MDVFSFWFASPESVSLPTPQPPQISYNPFCRTLHTLQPCEWSRRRYTDSLGPIYRRSQYGEGLLHSLLLPCVSLFSLYNFSWKSGVLWFILVNGFTVTQHVNGNHFPLWGYLLCSWSAAAVNSVWGASVCLHTGLLCLWSMGLRGKVCVIKFNKCCQIIFPRGYNNTRSLQQCVMAPSSPNSNGSFPLLSPASLPSPPVRWAQSSFSVHWISSSLTTCKLGHLLCFLGFGGLLFFWEPLIYRYIVPVILRDHLG